LDNLELFHKIFFEECQENLNELESGLIGLEQNPTSERIDRLFRAAHTLKGNSATLGFADLVPVTHEMESLLSLLRSGSRKVDRQTTELLLEGTDGLRGLVESLRDGVPLDQDFKSNLLERLRRDSKPEEIVHPWTGTIHFRPSPNLLRSGNDIVLLFRALEQLGEMSVTVDSSQLPRMEDMEPELCFLSWRLELNQDIPEDLVREIFEWVEDDCELILESVSPSMVESPSDIEAEKEDVEIEQQSKALPEQFSDESAMQYIRVEVPKVDRLLNMVGELVITQSGLARVSEMVSGPARELLEDVLAQLGQNTREIQESVLEVRMVPISFALQRLPRLVRDLSQQLNKEVYLELKGESTELDKNILEQITDPLLHLVRNAIDHGLESPTERLDKGKPAQGRITVAAFYQSGRVVVEISDDGAGIDTRKVVEKARRMGFVAADFKASQKEALELLFLPGMSTREKVSEISGRGVGMDVVRRNVTAIGGVVDIETTLGTGTRLSLRLPLTLSILDGQLIRIGPEIFIFPLLSIVECFVLDEERVRTVGGKQVFHFREGYLPLVDLRRELGTSEPEYSPRTLAVVAESGPTMAAFVVDELLAQQQVVVKSLERNYGRVDGALGATVLGDGTISLILDTAGLLERSRSAKTRLVGAPL
jgi:two-component system, chemotaxis family, sensor kinase CheA